MHKVRPFGNLERLITRWLSACLDLDARKYAPAPMHLWIQRSPARPAPPDGSPLAALAAEGIATLEAGRWTAAEAAVACHNALKMFAAPPAWDVTAEPWYGPVKGKSPAVAARLKAQVEAGNTPAARQEYPRARLAALFDQFALAWGYGLIPDGPALAVPSPFTAGMEDEIGGADTLPARSPLAFAGAARGCPYLPLWGLDYLDTGDAGGRRLAEHRARVRALLLHVTAKLLPLFPADWIKPPWRALADFLPCQAFDAARQADMDAWVASERERRGALGAKP